jgi:hypothetical protein
MIFDRLTIYELANLAVMLAATDAALGKAIEIFGMSAAVLFMVLVIGHILLSSLNRCMLKGR